MVAALLFVLVEAVDDPIDARLLFFRVPVNATRISSACVVVALLDVYGLALSFTPAGAWSRGLELTPLPSMNQHETAALVSPMVPTTLMAAPMRPSLRAMSHTCDLIANVPTAAR
jgi:hypothetical protein